MSTWKRGLASRTWARARVASWRQASRVALDCRCDLLEFEPEHIVQQERRPLERREAFQRQHQRQCDVVLLLLFDDGIGKPRAHIGLALAPRRLELIETEPRDRAAQERLGLAHLIAVGLHPADEGLLHDVLGVSHGAEHAVSDAHELWTQRVEARRCVLVPGACHQAAAAFGAALAVALMAAGSANWPKPTAMRFHPLMTLIIKVSLTCSASVNCAFSAS